MIEPVVNKLEKISKKVKLKYEHKLFAADVVNSIENDPSNWLTYVKNTIDFITSTLGYGNVFNENSPGFVNSLDICSEIYDILYNKIKANAIDHNLYLSNSEYENRLRRGDPNLDIYYTEKYISALASTYTSNIAFIILITYFLGEPIDRKALNNILNAVHIGDYSFLVKRLFNLIIIVLTIRTFSSYYSIAKAIGYGILLDIIIRSIRSLYIIYKNNISKESKIREMK